MSLFCVQVGTLTVCFYPGAGPSANFCSLVLFHLDPGHNKYDEQPHELREVMQCTWMLSYRLMELLLLQLDGKPRPVDQTREQWLNVKTA